MKDNLELFCLALHEMSNIGGYNEALYRHRVNGKIYSYVDKDLHCIHKD